MALHSNWEMQEMQFPEVKNEDVISKKKEARVAQQTQAMRKV